MNKYFAVVFCLVLAMFSCGGDDSNTQIPVANPPETFEPVAIQKTNATKIYMHYMTWFETNESSGNGQWGYHWTMANKNPNNIDGNGRREIASHYYPLIGPYHSGDKKVIENHLLLLKYSGVDGLLIDWYGTYNVNDYAMIKQNTDQLIAMLDKVGLEYAIVYEDRFLNNIVNAGLAPTITGAAKTDMNYLQSNCFNDDNYIHINNQPLLLNFGPITLTTPAQWTTVFSNLNPKPTLLTLWNESGEAGANAAGEYAWVYQNSSYLTSFYNNNLPNLGVAFGSAYPGFNDYYAQGGGGASLGWTIDHNNGATLNETLSMAQNAGVDYVQLITWNDFGEGTMIEPTVEFAYNYVEKIRTFAGVQADNVFTDIGRLYNLRVQYQGNAAIQAKLDKVFGYFVSMQPDKAVQTLNEID
jgi:hypothetical protein